MTRPFVLSGFVARLAAMDQPDQERGDRHPGELVPIEEGKAEQRGLMEIIEGNPEQTDERQQQQYPQRRTPISTGVCTGLLRYWNPCSGRMVARTTIFIAAATHYARM